jgi:glycosyltransferase involved in cell wall biosynthesis
LIGVLPRYQAAIAVSLSEADELRRITDIPVFLIAPRIDANAVFPAPEPTGPPRLVFTATLNHPPNRDGIRWFADQVWPLVRRQLPDAQLDVVGRDAPRSVRMLARRDGISVIGSVPEMAPYFARAHAVVVPILTGAGSRVKIVEAMAAGRAVVSTSLGWEGLPHLEPDRHLLVADDPGAFSQATVRLLREPSLRRRLAGEARATAERHYDWRSGNEHETVLRTVVDPGGR